MSLLKLWSSFFESNEDRQFRKDLKAFLGFSPDDIAIYAQAFKHKSAVDDDSAATESNERLEFLGDAVVGSCVADYVYSKFPDADEGFLTQLRSKIVSRKNLNHVADKLKIQRFIVANIDNKQRVNSIKGNAFEALFGAIYLDKGNDYCLKFIERLVQEGVIDVKKLSTVNENFKSQLIEYGQKEKVEVVFELVSESGKGYEKNFKINAVVDGEALGTGQGRSKKIAEQAASKEAIQKINIDA